MALVFRYKAESSYATFVKIRLSFVFMKMSFCVKLYFRPIQGVGVEKSSRTNGMSVNFRPQTNSDQRTCSTQIIPVFNLNTFLENTQRSDYQRTFHIVF